MAMPTTLPFYPDSFAVDETFQLATGNVDQAIWTAPFPCEFLAFAERHTTADTAGGAVTVMPKKCTSGTAAASGTSLLSTALSLKTTANTSQQGSVVFSRASRTFAQGDSLCLDFSGVTDVTGTNVTAWFRRV